MVFFFSEPLFFVYQKTPSTECLRKQKMREGICLNVTDKTLISKIHKELFQTMPKKWVNNLSSAANLQKRIFQCLIKTYNILRYHKLPISLVKIIVSQCQDEETVYSEPHY